MKNYRLVLAAEKDLESIWLYTVQEWGIRQAEDYIAFVVVGVIFVVTGLLG